MKGNSMTSVANVRTIVFPPLEFTMSLAWSLACERSYIVREKHGRGGGEFSDLSSAIIFVEGECRAYGCPPIMHFDRSLAFIRAAG
jgi:hypothetical protein